MISLTSRHRYFLFPKPTDMRKSFDGLSGIVNRQPGLELMSGDVFIFLNRRRDRIKLLVWDRSGFVIWYKRLEQGTFEIPQPALGVSSAEMTWDQLVLILEGIKLESVRRKKRYSHSIKTDSNYAQNVENRAMLTQ